MRPAVLRNRRGMTLVEVIIALMFLSVGVLALAGTTVGTSRWRRLVTSRIELTGIAESKLEELRQRAIDATNPPELAPGGSLESSTANYWDEVFSSTGTRVIRRWTVEVDAIGLRTVTVAVGPNQSDRWHVRSLRMATKVVLQ
jgi:prepilin-type N-terminal cleavage/methylation domain-containing protein